MAGMNARHAARTRKTSCLATASHHIRLANAAAIIKKNTVLCGPGTGLPGNPLDSVQAAVPACGPQFRAEHSAPHGGWHWRWRWDLNPRRGCPLTRFRGVRPRPLGDSTAAEPTRPMLLRMSGDREPRVKASRTVAPALNEEVAEQGSAFTGQNAADHLAPVAEPAVAEHIPERTDGA